MSNGPHTLKDNHTSRDTAHAQLNITTVNKKTHLSLTNCEMFSQGSRDFSANSAASVVKFQYLSKRETDEDPLISASAEGSESSRLL